MELPLKRLLFYFNQAVFRTHFCHVQSSEKKFLQLFPNLLAKQKAVSMSSGTVTLTEWKERWEQEQIGFHQYEYHETLVQHIDRLIKGRKSIKIFFPLCGKSLDMKWMYDEGHSVVGVEASAKGIQDFFNENGLQFTTETAGKMTLYKTEDDRLKLYCGDFFDFNSSYAGKMQGIWDRGSLVAINIEDREKYSALMMELMDKDCQYLLDSFNFDASEYAGPPHPVLPDHIKALYGNACNIETVEVKDALGEKQKGWGVSWFEETLSVITLK